MSGCRLEHAGRIDARTVTWFRGVARLQQPVAILDIDVDVEHDAVGAVDELRAADNLFVRILEDAAHPHHRVADSDGRNG